MDLDTINSVLNTAPVPLTIMLAVWIYKLDRRMLEVEVLIKHLIREVEEL